jgi:hypothetical protein
MARRNPGGYGARHGENNYVERAESRFLREALQPNESGWLFTTVGEGVMSELDIAGVLPGANIFSLWYVPAMTKNVWASEVRLRVVTAAASTTAEVAVYSYENLTFKKIPYSGVILDTSTTGLKQVTLTQPVMFQQDLPLFIGLVCRSNTVELEGFQSGVVGRVIRCRTKTEANSLQGQYRLEELSTNSVQGTPFIAYLSKTAALVL